MSTTTDSAPRIDYRKDGRIWLHIDERLVTLKRPTMGEFREIRDQFHDMSDAMTDMIHDFADLGATIAARQEWCKKPEGPEPDPIDTVEPSGDKTEIRALDKLFRRAQRELGDGQERLRIDWLLGVIGQLSTMRVSEDQAESWMSAPTLPAEIVKHWQTVPLASGGR